MKTEKVKLRIACGTYQFIEVDLPEIVEMEEVLKLRDDIIKKELEAKYNCPHFFTQDYVAKSGRGWKECQNCGAQSYENEDGSWSVWKFPSKNK